MFRIRTIYDDTSAANRDAIEQVMAINRHQFPGARPQGLEHLRDQLRNPMRFGYRSILLVAENGRDRVRGFALLLHLPDIGVAYLDLISIAPDRTGRGMGGLLYQQVRETAAALGASDLFFECSVDDPEVVTDPGELEQNRRRLRFYERLGVRPIDHNRYASPAFPSDRDLYFLMLDSLGRARPPSRTRVRRVARAVLERKYAHLFDEAAIAAIVASFTDEPIQMRPLRYVRQTTVVVPAARQPNHATGIALIVNEDHQIHHVRDRGYVEAPVRIPVILREIEKTGLFHRIAPRRTPDALLTRVHDPAFVDYLKRACALLPERKSIYPVIFPVHNLGRPPRDIELQVGYYCTDTFTPLHRNVYPAARGAVDCAVTGAQRLVEGERLAYALVRPPGHHAERRVFGGFCYFNAAAVAAEYLSRFGPVAVLDIDYHHGNGTQDIFYRRADVLTVSIHGAPPTVYPHFAGFADEIGEADGRGHNLNLPLPEHIAPDRYYRALATALRRIRRQRPTHLVLCLGLDTAKADPTGTWSLEAADFQRIGRAIGALKLPTLVVQEGGYRTRTLGINARHFFEGLWAGHDAAAVTKTPAASPAVSRRRPHRAPEAR